VIQIVVIEPLLFLAVTDPPYRAASRSIAQAGFAPAQSRARFS